MKTSRTQLTEPVKQARLIINQVKQLIKKALEAVKEERIDYAEQLTSQAMNYLEHLSKLIETLEHSMGKGGGG